MFEHIVPINQDRHRDKKVRPIESYAFARGIHVASLMLNEFPIAAPVFPIVFLEQPGSEDFLAAVLLGFKAGENLFVDGNGQWTASYVPAMICRYPFALARTEEEGRFSLCIDEASGLLGDETGQPLFQDNGAPGEIVEKAKRYLIELQQMEQMTAAFCRKLKEKNMLAPLNVRVREEGTLRNVTGCYAVNEDRLGGLSDQAFLELRTSQYLPALYSHLISLAQIERLIRARESAAPSGQREPETKTAPGDQQPYLN